MAFFVYLFVLLVAAGSVIFGLDLTQSPLQPPSYATPAAQTTTNAPSTAPATAGTVAMTAAVSGPKTAASTVTKTAPESVGAAAHAQASAEEAQAQPAATAAVSTANHCAIDACAAAYRSFRASDCTYQPYDGGRRLCTKATSSGAPKRVAAARPSVHHASRSSDASRTYADRTYAERDSGDQSRRGWSFDLFGDAFDR